MAPATTRRALEWRGDTSDATIRSEPIDIAAAADVDATTTTTTTRRDGGGARATSEQAQVEAGAEAGAETEVGVAIGASIGRQRIYTISDDEATTSPLEQLTRTKQRTAPIAVTTTTTTTPIIIIYEIEEEARVEAETQSKWPRTKPARLPLSFRCTSSNSNSR